MERREASPPIYICLALIPAGSGLPRSSTLVQRILNGSHATLTNGPWGDVHQVIHRANHGRAEIAPNRKVFDDIQYARNIDFPRRLLPRFVRLTKGDNEIEQIAQHCRHSHDCLEFLITCKDSRRPAHSVLRHFVL
ncbi:hypothetical protein AB4Y32_38785, partial [Paraburkholderia phymatum]